MLYCAITYILYVDNILPFLISTGMDSMLLIALVVVAVVVGKPLSYLNCRVIGSSSVSQSTYQLGLELKKSFSKEGSQVQYSNWIGASRVTCYEMKAIWGLSIALWSVSAAMYQRTCADDGQCSVRFLRHLQRLPLAS